MNLRKHLAAVLVAAMAVPTGAVVASSDADPASAAEPAPVILNSGAQNGGTAQWAETQGLPDQGGVRTFYATFLVQHAPGRRITQVRLDRDFDGRDETTSGGTAVAVSGQTYVGSAGGIETSRVTVGVNVGRPGGFSCDFFGSRTRSVDGTIRARVVDSTGEVSRTTLNTRVRFVEDSNCFLVQDFPRLTSARQDRTEVVPGESIRYTFSCDDVDTGFGSDDECDRARVRWRRLDDGTVHDVRTVDGIGDNSDTSTNVSFPSQGYYVVEAQLGNENGGFPNTGGAPGGWVRLGNAVVNDPPSSLSSSIAFTGTRPSNPPSVNASPGGSIDAVATASDSGGDIQVLEWDAVGSSSFERIEYTVPVGSGGDIVHPSLTTAERTQAVSIATPGLKTVRTRVTDNGALDAGDSIRRQRTASATVRVNAVPTAGDVSTATDEDQAVDVHLAGADADHQPQPLRYILVSPPEPDQGSVGPITGDTVTFTPAPDFNGTATFTYRVDDGDASTVAAHALSDTATVTVEVRSVNDIPTVDPASATTAEDTPVEITMSGDDVEDGSALDYAVISQPSHGSASCELSGLCTYSPAPDFHGTDTFVVRGSDDHEGSATATVTVTVTPVNDAPQADDQHVVVPEDATGFPITLSGSDVDDLVLSFDAAVDDADHGTLSCLGEACTYTPGDNFFGTDSFTFSVSDGDLSDTGTVTIDVTEVNDAPVATDVPDAVTDEDVPLTLTLGGTDVDPEDQVTVAGATGGAHGTTAVTPPNDVTYSPAPDFHGVDTYDFTVTDGRGGFDDGTVTVTVNPVNDAPVAHDQAFTLAEDTPTILSIVGSDVDGDLLTWSVVDGPSRGRLFGTGPDVAYLPDLDANGADTFVVQVSDGDLVDTATITVTVTPVNDQPVADAAIVTIDEDSPVDLVLGASDLDGDPLAFTAPLAAPLNGSVECTGPQCTYTPDPDFHGAERIQFRVSDGQLDDSASITIVVRPVNDAPVALDLVLTTPEDTSVAVPLAATDVDGDHLDFTVSAPANGTIHGIAPDLVFTPNANWSGLETIGFSVDDGAGGTDSGMIEIVVAPVNDAPVATGGTATTSEGVPVSFQLGGSDVDDEALTFTIDEAPTSGVLACDPTGACQLTPDDDASGNVPVYYSVSDGSLSSPGVFTVVVDPVNDPPTASDQTAATAEDTPVSLSLEAGDVEGDELTYSVVGAPAEGVVECEGASCVYTPAPNANGTDTFTWAANDGTTDSNTAVFTITVAPVNDAPHALDVSATTDEDVPVAIDLLATDADGDPIAYAVEDAPDHGTVTISGSVATYTPAADHSGTDTFSYRATDPSGAFTVARATVVVDEVALLATNLVAEAAVARVQIPLFGVLDPASALVVFPGLEATLRASSGDPLPGRSLTFRVGTSVLCTAVTDADGVGRCASDPARSLAALLGLGYQVSFDGDLDHEPTTAQGPIVQVLTLRL